LITLYIPRAYGQSGGFTYNEQKRQIDLEKTGRAGQARGDWEDWKNTGGLSWKDKDDRKVTWMKDLDGQGGYLD
jgi:hypothetical protein